MLERSSDTSFGTDFDSFTLTPDWSRQLMLVRSMRDVIPLA